MSKIETTWKLLFDEPGGVRLIVEYHSDMRPEEHEAMHKKLAETARKLLALRPEFLGNPDRPHRPIPLTVIQNAEPHDYQIEPPSAEMGSTGRGPGKKGPRP